MYRPSGSGRASYRVSGETHDVARSIRAWSIFGVLSALNILLGLRFGLALRPAAVRSMSLRAVGDGIGYEESQDRTAYLVRSRATRISGRL